jgi:hypothetical protein
MVCVRHPNCSEEFYISRDVLVARPGVRISLLPKAECRTRVIEPWQASASRVLDKEQREAADRLMKILAPHSVASRSSVPADGNSARLQSIGQNAQFDKFSNSSPMVDCRCSQNNPPTSRESERRPSVLLVEWRYLKCGRIPTFTAAAPVVSHRGHHILLMRHSIHTKSQSSFPIRRPHTVDGIDLAIALGVL